MGSLVAVMVGKGAFLLFFLSLLFTVETNGVTVDPAGLIADNQCNAILYHHTVYHITSTLNAILSPLQLWGTLKDLDLRKTDLFKTAHKWINWPYLSYVRTPYKVKNLLELGGYLNYMSHDQDYDYYNNSDDDEEYIFNTERKGSVEEYAVFMAEKLLKYFESKEENSCNPSNPRFGKPGNTYIKELNDRIDNLEGSNETIQYITQQNYQQLTDYLEVPFKTFGVQQFLVYDSRPEWNEWTADKLAAVLNNFAFFGEYKTYSSEKAEEYVKSGLPGGQNPLTFILQNLKVLQSPKIEPVLRMAMSRFVAETENLDKDFFKALQCFLYVYVYNSAPLVGLEGTDVELFFTQLNQTYEESFIVKQPGMIRNPEVWIDFIDHVLVELERVNIDEVHYNIYAIILKFKMFLVRLDYDGKMAPTLDRLLANLEKNQFLFSCGMLPGMVEAAKSILTNMKSDQFWDSFNKAFKEFVNENFETILLPAFIIDSIQATMDTIAEELGVQKNMTDFFETKVTDTEHPSRRYFEATNYLKKHQKTNLYSLLQPNLGEIDLSLILKYLIRSLKPGVANVVTHFEPVARQAYEDIELTLLEYGIVNSSFDMFSQLTNEIMSKFENTD